jgi:DNA polymerase elongation subunit (family B)
MKPGMDIEEIRQVIEREAGCPVGLEGVYKWIRFCPSKTDELSGVPNRYFGCFTNGELKIRGLALRRRDTPMILKNMQNAMLALLTKANKLADCYQLSTSVQELTDEYRMRLKDGQATAQELAITFHLSKTPQEYVHDTLSSLAAKQLAASGIELHAGESVRYIIVSAKDKVKDWRVMALPLLEGPLEYDGKKYLELLERCAKEILGCSPDDSTPLNSSAV